MVFRDPASVATRTEHGAFLPLALLLERKLASKFFELWDAAQFQEPE